MFIDCLFSRWKLYKEIQRFWMAWLLLISVYKLQAFKKFLQVSKYNQEIGLYNPSLLIFFPNLKFSLKS